MQITPHRAAFIAQWQSNETNYRLDIVNAEDIPLPQQLLTQIKTGESLLLESDENLSFHYYLPKTDEIFTLKIPNASVVHNNDRSVNYLFTSLFYFALVFIVLAWAYPLIIRLIKLRNATFLFGKGNLSQRIKPSRFSYISDIENDFNNMANKIESLVADIKMLSGAVSHDLRTPLARIQLGIDTLSEEDNPVERRKYEKKITQNIAEMTTLVETLLQYARLEQNMLSLGRCTIELNAFLTQCQESFDLDNTECSIKTSGKPTFIDADSRYLKMAVNNVLSNAVKYGNGRIQITVENIGNSAGIAIADNGNGIPTHKRQTVLKPFVRGDTSHSTGYGFGLAVVKRIIEWHDGSIEISESNTLGGAKVVIEFDTAK
ncbi:ATP-binding protein [Agaribacter marinus]|uniref:histidine kinase n=1 Tax=Agaribacter marinus TaxID=1431249 RepID=A0AA37SUG8_9ALTE|nr:ATP-binding protein [Agaribacter marinus]GLR69472.1 hypothetical protein GCM10007852_03800 [Agaribacter marinus]